MKILFFEGIDGVGKSTVIRSLLERNSKYVQLTSEIDRRKVFSYPADIKSEVIKSTANMFFNVSRSLKDSKKIVIVDRFIWSEYVYGRLKGFTANWVIESSKELFKANDLDVKIVFFHTDNFRRIYNRVKDRKKDSHITELFLQDSQSIYENLFSLINVPEKKFIKINVDGKSPKQLSDLINKL